jgi:hypothetical protein
VAAGERFQGALEQLLFPLVDLIGMNAVLFCNFADRPVILAGVPSGSQLYERSESVFYWIWSLLLMIIFN